MEQFLNAIGCKLTKLHFNEQVADFGLSREEMVNKHASNIQGTFGYLDPEYISTRTFTKKSDVYSFGVLLFELIAARNPLQGLLEYVELVRSQNFDFPFVFLLFWDSLLITPPLFGTLFINHDRLL